jgi:hypothetical protein
MRTLSIIVVLMCAVVLMNCGSARAPHVSSASQSGRPDVITKSLFESKDASISEENIQRLLSGKIDIPDTIRVALFKYSSSSINRYYTSWWTDEEYLKTQQSFVDTLVQGIGLSSRVKKVIPVPTLMAGNSPSITQLRETAVRLQADILIVYSLASDIYYKYRMFQKNEAKAFATCETIVMDIRTGMIPHSAIVTREKLVIKEQQDLNDEETRKKAEREAVLLTLVETGKGISAYLNSAE